MKIIICGAGLAGYDMARYLARVGHEVTVVDRANYVTRRLENSMDVRSVVGHAAHPNVLARAGAADADMLVAVTAHDEINMIACQVAHTLFDVSITVARIREPSYRDANWADLFTRKGLPIDVIVSPEAEMAKAVRHRLDVPDSFDRREFGQGLVQLVGLYLTEACPVIDTSLRHLTELFPSLAATVVGISRGGTLFMPPADEEMQAGDQIWLVVATSAMQRTLKVFGQAVPRARRFVLLGAGRLGREIALSLNKQPATTLYVIEQNAERARALGDELDARHMVLHGSVFDSEIQQQLPLNREPEVLALTGQDQTNILATQLLRQRGCRLALCVINEPGFADFGKFLGVQSVINPRTITTSSILKHVRKGRITDVYALAEGQGEIVEAEALESSALCGHALREMKLPRDMRIGAVVRGDKVLVPRGDTEIAAGDHVILFALARAQKTVAKLFSASAEYL
ncbi:MAG: Trk system potassium transporter TrkA [Hyphomicrobiales bacterium]|nr:Trk system potassium transporter TrkA [Hyphomicrobiales bacterium]